MSIRASVRTSATAGLRPRGWIGHRRTGASPSDPPVASPTPYRVAARPAFDAPSPGLRCLDAALRNAMLAVLAWSLVRVSVCAATGLDFEGLLALAIVGGVLRCLLVSRSAHGALTQHDAAVDAGKARPG